MGTCLARCRAKNSTSAELSHPCSPRFNQHLPLTWEQILLFRRRRWMWTTHATGQGPHERKPSLTKNWAEFAEPQVPSNLHMLHKFRNIIYNQKSGWNFSSRINYSSHILTTAHRNVVHGNNLSSYFHMVASASQTTSSRIIFAKSSLSLKIPLFLEKSGSWGEAYIHTCESIMCVYSVYIYICQYFNNLDATLNFFLDSLTMHYHLSRRFPQWNWIHPNKKPPPTSSTWSFFYPYLVTL